MPAALSITKIEEAKHLLATGLNQTEVAKQAGIGRNSSNTIANKYKTSIEKLALDLVKDSIPLIKYNHIQTLKLANDVLRRGDVEQIEASKTLLTLADKKEFRTLQIMGIAPSHTASVVINNLFSVQSMAIVDPSVQAALGSQLDDILSPDDVTEADYTDDMSNIEGDS